MVVVGVILNPEPAPHDKVAPRRAKVLQAVEVLLWYCTLHHVLEALHNLPPHLACFGGHTLVLPPPLAVCLNGGEP
jgi:hypothetical protein